TDDGDYTETRMIEIKNGSAETTVFDIPVGKLATVVDVKTADTPKVAVEGLGEILTAGDRNAAAAGAQDIEVKLEAAKKAEGEAEGASAIKAIVESGKQVAVYIDLSLYKTTKTLDDKGAVTATDTIDIGATNNKVLEIAIPFSDAKTKEVKVYRYHGGAAAELAALADKPAGSFTDGTYYVDKDNGYIFLYASEFSTYAITTPKTGGNRKPTAATTEGAIGVNPAPDDGACKKDRTCPIWPFSDASPAAWYHDGVHWALEEGVMRGYSAALFGPNDATTRAQVAQMLYNIEGKPAVGNEAIPFADVERGMWYADAISWAAESGVVLGFERDGADVFDPDAAVTREQFAAMMQRYAKLKGADVSVGADLNIERFSDAGSVSLWATDAMRWAVEEKLITGRTEETLVPLGTATRAEIATILMRYFKSAS
ncbi:MAG: S-layer homology domain-containing protein, partial [Firmicutes bacterium]|nr:S-layer homology domain-containing protein [Bacillota bacterium]